MVLFLGVAKALRAMHLYKVKGGSANQERARGVRQSAVAADADASRQVRRRGGEDDEDDNVPLMDNEIVQSQDGVAAGELRAYAHRDIKPG